MLAKLHPLAMVSLVALSLQAQASSEGVTRQIPVNDDFIEGTVRMSGAAGRLDFRINIINANNVLELCGVMAVSGTTKREFDRFLRDSAFEINDKKVVKDLRYWNRTNRNQLDVAVANCRSTGIRVNAKIDSIGMAWSKKQYRE